MRLFAHSAKRLIALFTLLLISPILLHLLWPVNTVQGLDRLPDFIQAGHDLDVVAPTPCGASVEIVPIIQTTGVMVPGTRVDLDASSTRLYVTNPVLGSNVGCDRSVSFFGEDFEWNLTQRPPGSNASLSDPDTTTPFFTPDIPGEYVIRYTGCPDGCEHVMESGLRFLVGPTSKDVVIEIQNEVVIPPETEPFLIPEDPKPKTTFPDAEEKCQFSAGFWNPQWVTVDRWGGPGNYRLLEGEVLWSKISRKDNLLNHDSQDFNFKVKPDPSTTDLLAGGSMNMNSMEVEWERDHFPEVMRPTRGDRISVIGYWIHDCGHGARTEIHPPVLMASHRARPVQIPDSAGFGSNIFVPGVVTHLWINENAGETTRTCNQTGLHQPRGGQGIWFGPHSCLPQTEGFDRNPIDTTFTFNIYLPKNPQKIYSGVGLNAPAAALYVETFNPEGAGGNEPEIIEHLEDGFLEVRLDLRQFTGSTYSRRIEAGWIYPSPDNWDLQAWRLEIDKIDVHNDGDGWDSGDGDWRFWANITNTTQEWTKLFDCGGCVHGVEDFNGNPWRTSPSGGINSLGPDILLYPGQDIWVHTSGFEDDTWYTDDTGHISEILEQETGTYAIRRECTESGRSGCADYTLHFRILRGDPVGPANLSRLGQRIFDSYLVSRIPRPGDIFTPPFARNWNHPMRAPLPREDGKETPFNGSGFFPQQGVEPNSIGDMSNEDFRAKLALLQDEDLEMFENFMGELREEVDSILVNRKVPETLAEMAELKNALPAALWAQHFSDIKIPGKTILPGVPNWVLILSAGILALLVLFFILRKKLQGA